MYYNAKNDWAIAQTVYYDDGAAGDAGDAAAKAAAAAAGNADAAKAAEEAAEEAAAKAAADAAKDTKASFTPEQQAEIDKMLQGQTDSAKKALAELDAIKKRNDLTDGQRQELEQRYTNMEKELLTKEQLFEQDKKKKEKKHNEILETITGERDTWKNRFTNSTISKSITEAAAQNEAFDSDTIDAILRPKTSLIESLDTDGKATGEFTPKVRFLDPEGKDGKPAELHLTVSEAVKRMTELSKYQYLFKGRGTGGMDLQNGTGGKAADISKLAKNPAAYREARKNKRVLN